MMRVLQLGPAVAALTISMIALTTCRTAAVPCGAAGLSEGALLADRIFNEAGRVPEGDERCDLIHDIADVLHRIRESHPDMAQITARRHHVPGVLLVGLSPRLLQSVAGGQLLTGHEGFDRLNSAFGLESVTVLEASGTAVLRFDPALDIEAATMAYDALEDVVYAEPDRMMGDGPDVIVARHEGAWHVTFRDAWGDCPSGCIFERLTSFEVTEEGMERIDGKADP